jgi:peptide/nickel transport system substrate-binding protein
MKKFRWQIIIILITGLVMGLLLLSEQTGFRLVSPVPTSGGVYNEALIGNLQRLNPILDYYNSADRDVDRLIFSSLIKFDDKGLPIADLAKTWGISYDGLTYNFELRENAKWHDGTRVTADDVLFTVDLMRDADSVLPDDVKKIWSNVDVVVLSDTLVHSSCRKLMLPSWIIWILAFSPSISWVECLYMDIVNSQFNLSPVGSGPYKFENLIVEDNQIKGIVLASNKDYYLNPPYINDFVFHYYDDDKSAYAAYQEGTVQGISKVSQDILPDVLGNSDLSFTAQLSLIFPWSFSTWITTM